MTHHIATGWLLGLAFFVLPGPAQAQATSPYAGEQHREIKALSAKEVENPDILARSMRSNWLAS
jgi:hypothetical protein